MKRALLILGSVMTFSCAGARAPSELPLPAAKNAMAAAASCTGSNIDLAAVLKNRSCLIDHAEPWTASETLETSVTLSKATVFPGDRVDVTLTYTNKDTVAASVVLANAYVAWGGGPRVETFFEKRRAIGESSVLAEGDTRNAFTEGFAELKLMRSVDEPGIHSCGAARVRDSYSRITLPPGGVARITLPWTATRAHATHFAHGPIETCDVVALTPLHPGTYTLGIASPRMVSTGKGVELERHLMRVQVNQQPLQPAAAVATR